MDSAFIKGISPRPFESSQFESLEGARSPQTPKTSIGASSDSFLDMLQETIQRVNEVQKEADSKAQLLSSGGDVALHEVMIAMEKADLSLRTVTSVRNKIVEAYQEIMRMQV
jgi:flagellar hook-basal body complex protein FliE